MACLVRIFRTTAAAEPLGQARKSVRRNPTPYWLPCPKVRRGWGPRGMNASENLGRSRKSGRALGYCVVSSASVALLVVAGSRRLAHFDAALVAYTFIFAVWAASERYKRVVTRSAGTRTYAAVATGGCHGNFE